MSRRKKAPRRLPEVVAAIAIADKHLADLPAERRMALALDIHAAIIRHAASIAVDIVGSAVGRVRGGKVK